MPDAAPKRTRWALALYVACFCVGASNHAYDFLRFGWRPYRWGSIPLEIFWTSLIALDLLVVGFLVAGRRRSGLILAAVVMTSDVAANAYAWKVMNILAFGTPLLLQTGFFGFIVGSIAFLWPRNEEPA
jgi:hypothetical protein